MLFNTGLSNFFGYVSLGKRNKSQNKQWDSLKLKSYQQNNQKKTPTELEKIFVKDISDKGLNPKYTKDSYNTTTVK